MKPRETVRHRLNGGTPDRVPVFDFLFSPKLQKELLGHTTDLYDGESQVKLAAMLGLDAQFIPVNGYCGFEDESHPVGSLLQGRVGRHVREERLARDAADRRAGQEPRGLEELPHAGREDAAPREDDHGRGQGQLAADRHHRRASWVRSPWRTGTSRTWPPSHCWCTTTPSSSTR